MIKKNESNNKKRWRGRNMIREEGAGRGRRGKRHREGEETPSFSPSLYVCQKGWRKLNCSAASLHFLLLLLLLPMFPLGLLYLSLLVPPILPLPIFLVLRILLLFYSTYFLHLLLHHFLLPLLLPIVLPLLLLLINYLFLLYFLPISSVSSSNLFTSH